MPGEKSSSGQHFSENSYGHTGFTGTSIWIDPEKDLIGILLTNRVHPTRENRKLYEFRYKIYNLLQESVKD
ncbi:MAG: beta-lactamase family protein [Candidatus Methanoperedenaceae archaeon]|nr:beta-lactamase family protein [Candidatus Methanoperedenaceae archaeon]